MDDLSNHEKSAQSQPRDENGHFIPKSSPSPDSSPAESNSSHPLHQYIANNTRYDKKHDDLLDIHVGNPLARITQLLQDIKKQKAFSFTLKGSLGIMGVGLVLSTFGIFGGAKLLCDKGRQTHVGIVRVLGTVDEIDYQWPLIQPVVEYYKNFMHPGSIDTKHPRAILQTNGSDTIYIPYNKEVDMSLFNKQKVLVTGEFDSCSRTLRVDDRGAIEIDH